MVSKGFYQLYRHCDPAYSSMDMLGIGHVEPQVFSTSIAAQRVVQSFNNSQPKYKLRLDHIKDFTFASNLF